MKEQKPKLNRKPMYFNQFATVLFLRSFSLRFIGVVYFPTERVQGDK